MNEENNVINSDWIYSMANRHKRETGLPVNIWLDEGKEYIDGKHGKRIKFQTNYGNSVQKNNLASMKLNGDVVEETYDKTVSEINKHDINEVSNFVKNNSYALDKLADELIYSSDFDKVMIKGGEPASPEQIAEQKRMVDEIISEENNVIEM